MRDLVKIEQINAVQLFDGEKLDPLLEKIREQVRGFVPDLSTAKGRAEIASLAHKVAQSKTLLDTAGKYLVSGWKQKAKAVDAERKKMREYLDDLKKEVRQPLTEWEEKEKIRVAEIRERIDLFFELSVEYDENAEYLDSKHLAGVLKRAEGIAIDESFCEFANEAAAEKDLCVSRLKGFLARRLEDEKRQAEVERLRKEAEDRKRAEHEERLRVEGEQRAKDEAERKAKVEAEREAREKARIEAEKVAAVKAKEDAEQRAVIAEREAKRLKVEEAQREKERKEMERAEAIAVKVKKEAFEKHKADVVRSITEAFSKAGVSLKGSRFAAKAVLSGKIPYVSIDY